MSAVKIMAIIAFSKLARYAMFPLAMFRFDLAQVSGGRRTEDCEE